MLFDHDGIPERTKESVRALAKRGRLPQSVLLSGGSEHLRETCADELAAAVICLSPADGAPCKKCAACKKLKAGTHPDVIRVKPEKDKKTVSVDTVRALVLDSLYIAPNEAEDKVYIFYNAQDLSPLIQNALLKTIEEPPPFVMFIFLCDQRDKLLSTVISRVTEFPLGDVLSAQKKKGREEELEIACGVVNAICRKNEYALMKSTAPMIKKRQLMKKVAARVILLVRDAAAASAGANEFFGGSDADALMLSEALTPAELYAVKAHMESVIDASDANANENLLVTRFSSGLAEILIKDQ